MAGTEDEFAPERESTLAPIRRMTRGIYKASTVFILFVFFMFFAYFSSYYFSYYSPISPNGESLQASQVLQGWNFSASLLSHEEPRVAICLTGGLRKLELTGPSLKQYLFDAYPNADVFITTPFDSDTFKLWTLNGSRVVSIHVVKQFPFPSDVMLKSVLYGNWPPAHNSIMQYAGLVERCKTLILKYEIKHGIKYDWVMRTRPDGLWRSKPPPLNQISFEKLHIPPGNNWYGINDRLSFASREISLKAMSWLTSIQGNYYKGQRGLTAEAKFLAMLKNLGLQNKIVRTSFDFCVLTSHTYRFPLRWNQNSAFSCPVSPLYASELGDGRYCKPCVAVHGIPLSLENAYKKFHTKEFCNGTEDWPRNWKTLFDDAMGPEIAKQRKYFDSRSNFWACVQLLEEFLLTVDMMEGEKDAYILCHQKYSTK